MGAAMECQMAVDSAAWTGDQKDQMKVDCLAASMVVTRAHRAAAEKVGMMVASTAARWAADLAAKKAARWGDRQAEMLAVLTVV